MSTEAPIEPSSVREIPKYDQNVTIPFFGINGAFSDITVKVLNKEYKSHKLVLAACSKYFWDELNSKEGIHEISITLPSFVNEGKEFTEETVDAAMKLFLQFAYENQVFSRISVPATVSASLLLLASVLQCKSLSEALAGRFLEQVTSTNAFSQLKLAEKMGNEVLIGKVVEYICQTMSVMVFDKELISAALDCSRQSLCSIFSSDNLNIDKEDIAYRNVMALLEAFEERTITEDYKGQRKVYLLIDKIEWTEDMDLGVKFTAECLLNKKDQTRKSEGEEEKKEEEKENSKQSVENKRVSFFEKDQLHCEAQGKDKIQIINKTLKVHNLVDSSSNLPLSLSFSCLQESFLSREVLGSTTLVLEGEKKNLTDQKLDLFSPLTSKKIGEVFYSAKLEDGDMEKPATENNTEDKRETLYQNLLATIRFHFLPLETLLPLLHQKKLETVNTRVSEAILYHVASLANNTSNNPHLSHLLSLSSHSLFSRPRNHYKPPTQPSVLSSPNLSNAAKPATDKTEAHEEGEPKQQSPTPNEEETPDYIKLPPPHSSSSPSFLKINAINEESQTEGNALYPSPLSNPNPKLIHQNFIFEFLDDSNGVFANLATRSGLWVNPSTTGAVHPFSSSCAYGELLDITTKKMNNFRTMNAPESYVGVSLERKRLMLTGYTIRTPEVHSHALISWKMQGSNNGTVWQDLDIRYGCSALRFPRSISYFAVAMNGDSPVRGGSQGGSLVGGKAFSMFRILQTGPNSSGTHALVLSNFELYGYGDGMDWTK